MVITPESWVQIIIPLSEENKGMANTVEYFLIASTY